MSTNWTTPKRNILAGMNDLRKALAAGMNARLIREWNEKCMYPIRVKNQDSDFRSYKTMYGTTSSVNKIKENKMMSETEKHLSLNYCSVFGDKEAADHYYETGELKKNSLHTPGYNFNVQVDDLIKYYREAGEPERANRVERQYRAPEHVHDVVHWFDFFSYKHGCPFTVSKFKRKLWVVDLLKEDEKVKTPFLVHLISVLVYPLKWIPKRSTLRMDNYKLVTFRWGDVINGFSIEFHLPKKFSFN